MCCDWFCGTLYLSREDTDKIISFSVTDQCCDVVKCCFFSKCGKDSDKFFVHWSELCAFFSNMFVRCNPCILFFTVTDVLFLQNCVLLIYLSIFSQRWGITHGCLLFFSQHWCLSMSRNFVDFTWRHVCWWTSIFCLQHSILLFLKVWICSKVCRICYVTEKGLSASMSNVLLDTDVL